MTASPTEGRERPVIFSGSMVRAILAGRKTQTRRVLKLPPKQFEHPAMGGWEPTTNGGGGCFRLGRGGERIPVAETVGIWHRTTGWCQDAPHQAGDRLWVRETWQTGSGYAGPQVAYRATEDAHDIDAWDGEDEGAGPSFNYDRLPGLKWHTWLPDLLSGAEGAWRSPIHMPRALSRITLEVTEVRVERLASISREDAIAEGATSRPRCCGCNGLADGWSMDWSQVGQPSRWAADGRTLSERDIALWSPQDAFGSFINELHDPRWNHKGDGIFGENPWVAAITFRPVSVPPSGGKA